MVPTLLLLHTGQSCRSAATCDAITLVHAAPDVVRCPSSCIQKTPHGHVFSSPIAPRKLRDPSALEAKTRAAHAKTLGTSAPLSSTPKLPTWYCSLSTPPDLHPLPRDPGQLAHHTKFSSRAATNRCCLARAAQDTHPSPSSTHLHLSKLANHIFAENEIKQCLHLSSFFCHGRARHPRTCKNDTCSLLESKSSLHYGELHSCVTASLASKLRFPVSSHVPHALRLARNVPLHVV